MSTAREGGGRGAKGAGGGERHLLDDDKLELGQAPRGHTLGTSAEGQQLAPLLVCGQMGARIGSMAGERGAWQGRGEHGQQGHEHNLHKKTAGT